LKSPIIRKNGGAFCLQQQASLPVMVLA